MSGEKNKVGLPLSHVQRDIFGIEVLNHGPAGLVHEFLSQTQTPVGTLDCLLSEEDTS